MNNKPMFRDNKTTFNNNVTTPTGVVPFVPHNTTFKAPVTTFDIYTKRVKPKRVNYLSDYNDPSAINSLADVISATINPKGYDNALGLDIPILNLIPNAVKMLKDTTVAPALNGEFGAVGVNLLMNLGETFDVVANPIKGFLFEGTSGFVDGLGIGGNGRVNHTFDTGNMALDIMAELVIDPLNWISFGGWMATKNATKATVAGMKEVAGDLSSELSEKAYTTLAKRASRAFLYGDYDTMDESLRAIMKDFQKSNGKYVFTSEPTTEQFIEVMKKMQSATEQYHTNKIMKGFQKLVAPKESFEKMLLKGVGYSSGIAPAWKAGKYGFDKVKNALTSSHYQKLSKAGALTPDGNISLFYYDKIVEEFADSVAVNNAALMKAGEKMLDTPGMVEALKASANSTTQYVMKAFIENSNDLVKFNDALKVYFNIDSENVVADLTKKLIELNAKTNGAFEDSLGRMQQLLHSLETIAKHRDLDFKTKGLDILETVATPQSFAVEGLSVTTLRGRRDALEAVVKEQGPLTDKQAAFHQRLAPYIDNVKPAKVIKDFLETSTNINKDAVEFLSNKILDEMRAITKELLQTDKVVKWRKVYEIFLDRAGMLENDFMNLLHSLKKDSPEIAAMLSNPNEKYGIVARYARNFEGAIYTHTPKVLDEALEGFVNNLINKRISFIAPYELSEELSLAYEKFLYDYKEHLLEGVRNPNKSYAKEHTALMQRQNTISEQIKEVVKLRKQDINVERKKLKSHSSIMEWAETTSMAQNKFVSEIVRSVVAGAKDYSKSVYVCTDYKALNKAVEALEDTLHGIRNTFSDLIDDAGKGVSPYIAEEFFHALDEFKDRVRVLLDDTIKHNDADIQEYTYAWSELQQKVNSLKGSIKGELATTKIETTYLDTHPLFKDRESLVDSIRKLKDLIKENPTEALKTRLNEKVAELKTLEQKIIDEGITETIEKAGRTVVTATDKKVLGRAPKNIKKGYDYKGALEFDTAKIAPVKNVFDNLLDILSEVNPFRIIDGKVDLTQSTILYGLKREQTIVSATLATLELPEALANDLITNTGLGAVINMIAKQDLAENAPGYLAQEQAKVVIQEVLRAHDFKTKLDALAQLGISEQERAGFITAINKFGNTPLNYIEQSPEHYFDKIIENAETYLYSANQTTKGNIESILDANNGKLREEVDAMFKGGLSHTADYDAAATFVIARDNGLKLTLEDNPEVKHIFFDTEMFGLKTNQGDMFEIGFFSEGTGPVRFNSVIDTTDGSLDNIGATLLDVFVPKTKEAYKGMTDAQRRAEFVKTRSGKLSKKELLEESIKWIVDQGPKVRLVGYNSNKFDIDAIFGQLKKHGVDYNLINAFKKLADNSVDVWAEIRSKYGYVSYSPAAKRNLRELYRSIIEGQRKYNGGKFISIYDNALSKELRDLAKYFEENLIDGAASEQSLLTKLGGDVKTQMALRQEIQNIKIDKMIENGVADIDKNLFSIKNNPELINKLEAGIREAKLKWLEDRPDILECFTDLEGKFTDFTSLKNVPLNNAEIVAVIADQGIQLTDTVLKKLGLYEDASSFINVRSLIKSVEDIRDSYKSIVDNIRLTADDFTYIENKFNIKLDNPTLVKAGELTDPDSAKTLYEIARSITDTLAQTKTANMALDFETVSTKELQNGEYSKIVRDYITKNADEVERLTGVSAETLLAKFDTDEINITKLLSGMTVEGINEFAPRIKVKTQLINDWFKFKDTVIPLSTAKRATMFGRWLSQRKAAIRRPDILAPKTESITNALNKIRAAIAKAVVRNPDAILSNKGFAELADQVVHADDIINPAFLVKLQGGILSNMRVDSNNVLDTYTVLQFYYDTLVKNKNINPQAIKNLIADDELFDLLSDTTGKLRKTDVSQDALNYLNKLEDSGIDDAIGKPAQFIEAAHRGASNIEELNNLGEILDYNGVYINKTQMLSAALIPVYELNKTLVDIIKKSPDDFKKIVGELETYTNKVAKQQTYSLLSESPQALLSRMTYDAPFITMHHTDVVYDKVAYKLYQDWLAKSGDYKKVGIELIQEGDRLYFVNTLLKDMTYDVDAVTKEVVYKLNGAVIPKPELKGVDIERLGTCFNDELTASLIKAREGLTTLTNGRGADTLGNTIDGSYVADLYGKLPDAVKNKLPSKELITDFKLFREARFDYMNVGSISGRRELQPFLPKSIVKTYTQASEVASLKAKTVVQWTNYYYRPEFSISAEGSYGKFSNDELKSFLDSHPEFTLTALVKDAKTGHKVVRIDHNIAGALDKARELKAIITPYQTYSHALGVINENRPSNVFLKFWHKMIYTYKVGYLLAPPVWFRNYYDSTLKNMIETGEGLEMFKKQFEAMGLTKNYDQVIGDILALNEKGYGNLVQLVQSISEGSETMARETYDKITKLTDDLKLAKNREVAFSLLEKFYEVNDDIIKMDPVKKFSKTNLEFYFKHMHPSMDFETYKAVDAFLKNGPSAGMGKVWEDYYKSFGDIDSAWATFVNGSSKLMAPNTMIEQVNRLAELISLKGQGFNNTEAYYKIAKTHFDYGVKSDFGRAMENVVPFYTFTMKNLEYWVNAVEENPWLLRQFENMMSPVWDFDNTSRDELAFNKSLEYQVLSGNIPITDSGMTLKLSPSYMDVFNMMTDPMGAGLSKVFSPIQQGIREATAGTVAGNAMGVFENTSSPNPITQLPIVGTLYQKIAETGPKYYERTGNVLNLVSPGMFGATKRWTNAKYRPKSYSQEYSYSHRSYFRNYYAPRYYPNSKPSKLVQDAGFYKAHYNKNGKSKLRKMGIPVTGHTLQYRIKDYYYYKS